MSPMMRKILHDDGEVVRVAEKGEKSTQIGIGAAVKGVMKRRQTGLSHSLVVRDDKEMAVVEMIVGSAVTVIAVEEIARIAIEIGGRMKTAIGGHQRKRGHHQVRGQSRQPPEVEVVMTMMTMTAVTEVIIAAITPMRRCLKRRRCQAQREHLAEPEAVVGARHLQRLQGRR